MATDRSSPTPIAIEPLTLVGPAATAELGRRLAGVLRPGDVVALGGDLGAGKSTLARACLQALAGVEIEVPSPTFTLVQTYDLPAFPVWHVDLYRLGDSAEVDELGLEEALERGALLVEWPERLPDDVFPNRLTIRLEATAPDRRRLRAVGGPGWADRIGALTAPVDLD